MANIPIFIPHAGCKNDCVFCNQKSITGKSALPSFEETKRIIEENLETLGEGDNTVAFFGGSFTGIGLDLMEGYLRVGKSFVDSGKVKGIRLSTRPDYIDEEILDVLEKYSVTSIELGAQSMDDEVLYLSKRGHDSECVKKAAERINARGITLGLQMMIGLPGDSCEKSIATAKEFVRLGARETRIYPTVVIKDTLLEKMYEKGEYVPMSFDEAINAAADCYGIFTENSVKVLRIGLQNSEELKKSVVGGFYHDALGEMVFSRVVRNAVERAGGKVEIRTNKRFLSKVIGQKRENILYFEKMGIDYALITDDACEGVAVNRKTVLTI